MKRKTASPKELSALIEDVRARVPSAVRDLAREAVEALVEGATGARPLAEVLRSPGGRAAVGACAAAFGAGVVIGRASASPRAVTAAMAGISAGVAAGLIVHTRCCRQAGAAGQGDP